jgi:hypothetical protein
MKRIQKIMNKILRESIVGKKIQFKGQLGILILIDLFIILNFLFKINFNEFNIYLYI